MIPSRPSLVATSLSRWASASIPRAKTARPPKSQLQTPKASGSSQTTSSASTGSSSKPTSWSSPSKRQQRADVVQQSRFNAAHPSHNLPSKASPSRTRGATAAPSSSSSVPHSRVTLNSTTYPATSGPHSSPALSPSGQHVKGGENKSLWQSWKDIPPRNRMALGVVAGIIGILGVVLDNQSESIFPSLQSKPHEKINGEEEPKLIAFKIKDRVEEAAPPAKS